MNYQSSKVDVQSIWQTIETMIKFIKPNRTSVLHSKNKWVNFKKSDD